MHAHPDPRTAGETPLARLAAAVAQVLRGKDDVIRLCVAALLARGHVLIEDVPGVGKTTLARALARALGGTFRRIQFTSDLLPSDIVGVSVFDPQAARFHFRPGPIFAHVVLADEINRASPRTQSSLLEAMSDGQVTVDDRTYELERPFLVLATQNPQEPFGTYPLPESQMDRFLLRVAVGYPAAGVERALVAERGGGDLVAGLAPVVGAAEVQEEQARVDRVRVAPALLDYAMGVVAATRRAPGLALGVSPRGAISWYRAAQAHARVAGRDYAVPDDFQALALPALAHRVVPAQPADSLAATRREAERAIREIVERTPVPL
jgi:MoxR-like ATPase